MKRSNRDAFRVINDDPFPEPLELPLDEALLWAGPPPSPRACDVRTCRSCNTKKVEADFIHPTKGTVGRTCAACIMKRSGAAARGVQDLEVSRTLADHEARLASLEGATWRSGRADLAEWLRLADPDEPVGSGDLVECLGRCISRRITGRGALFVVSSEPFFTGNMPDDDRLLDGRAVAMVGQVPVRVRGPCAADTTLAPSGLDDGTAVAAPGCGSRVVAMDAAPGGGGVALVRCLVNAGE